MLIARIFVIITGLMGIDLPWAFIIGPGAIFGRSLGAVFVGVIGQVGIVLAVVVRSHVV